MTDITKIATKPLIEAKNLRIVFGRGEAAVEVVHGISFTLGREKLGIVGESGAGKSTIGRAIMRLSPPGARVTADRLTFKDVDLLKASEKEMMGLRGRRIGLILQDPKYSLNPVVPVGEQIAEAWRLHHPGRQGAREAAERTLSILEAVKIRDPKRVTKLYPHEISGGMGQRVMIAMMLIAGPDVLIADEPTSALDVTVRLEVLTLLDELIESRGLGLILISHDLNLVRRFCDRVVIMYAGRIMETLKASDLDKAEHPYTRGLLGSLPSIHSEQHRLPVLTRDPAWLLGTGATR
ncbi:MULTISPECIES: ABC transporter ATP-binding protein [unclassified Chelatococcus]|uniref:ABC transporter ATP-binding protein n=1 Tax=unclassified Chelatococcus TaxID=2638111 RepID=UPI001BCE063E|nr:MULTISPECIES: ABC transporter ATP-binding protein [unclassified Chelatococcus]CAH1663050.1 Peptide/nickel transport system ATP-binding protein [Hyphomicrobiales bacterium]MBS7741520.1 ABC transporter ATP-binding protein [Chelatococcus sp. HY11]MBX3544461.1 ABC transporter ATP-binding protein [Chelatococcus sp.]MCO5079016.1 ABC transporter ATP-binding protein [Chelatococcus sp.]CAH1682412.1 Peptide/nickel transport system ATP-binding protein [Hyphomicrobiales bacterium]